jgi:hypothetical protein
MRRLFVTAEKRGVVSATLVRLRVAFMRRSGSTRTELRYAAQKATDVYPHDEAVWVERLRLEIDGPDSGTNTIFNAAMSAVSWSSCIWELYCDWIDTRTEEGELSAENALEAYEVRPDGYDLPERR